MKVAIGLFRGLNKYVFPTNSKHWFIKHWSSDKTNVDFLRSYRNLFYNENNTVCEELIAIGILFYYVSLLFPFFNAIIF